MTSTWRWSVPGHRKFSSIVDCLQQSHSHLIPALCQHKYEQMSKAPKNPGTPYDKPVCPASLLQWQFQLQTLKRHFWKNTTHSVFCKISTPGPRNTYTHCTGFALLLVLLHQSARLGCRILVFTPILISTNKTNLPHISVFLPKEEQCDKATSKDLAVMEPSFLNT